MRHPDNAPIARAAKPGDDPARKPTSYGPRTGRRLQIAAAMVAIVLLAAFFVVRYVRGAVENELAWDTKEQASQPPAVVVVTASEAPSTASLTLPGNTAAWYESTIYARVSGYVAKWSVDIGDPVEKGQVLATIETPDLDAELAGAEAKLKSAEADVHVREAQAIFAKTTYERWRDSPKGVVSEQERDAKKADDDSAAAQLNAALANVNADRGDVDRLTALSQFKQVTAPYDGTITERRIDIGNLVTAGSNSGTTSLYRMSQDDPMRVFVDVPQSAAADMTPGVPAAVAVNGMPDHLFDGAIVRTARALDPKSRTLRVEVDIPNRNLLLVPGLYVAVNFQLKAKGVVEVPAAAMIFRSSGPQVATVGEDGTVKFHDVEIARDDGNVVELASGVSPDDKVVLNISNQVADGEKVAATVSNQGLAAAPPDRPTP